MITEYYTVFTNSIFQDESEKFPTPEAAIQHCRQVYEDTGQEVWVYGTRDYSKDDLTPAAARTYFWRHWGIRSNGVISKDGR